MVSKKIDPKEIPQEKEAPPVNPNDYLKSEPTEQEVTAIEFPVASAAGTVGQIAAIQSAYTVEYAQAVRVVQDLFVSSREAFDLRAKKAGIKVAEKASLENVVAEVVAAEFEKAGKPVYIPGSSPEEVAARHSVAAPPSDENGPVYQSWTGRARTMSSGDKVRTDEYGRIINRKG